MRVFPADGREIGFCIAGQKAKCRKLGIDFKSYIRNGIDVEDLRVHSDADLTRLIRHVEEKTDGQ